MLPGLQALCVKVLPRLTWMAFFIILLVWICLYGAGFKSWSHMNPVPLLSYHYFFMSLAWPVCMTEAILSYRAPLIPFKQRRCGPASISITISRGAACLDVRRMGPHG